jgi:hypothetical protein
LGKIRKFYIILLHKVYAGCFATKLRSVNSKVPLKGKRPIEGGGIIMNHASLISIQLFLRFACEHDYKNISPPPFIKRDNAAEISLSLHTQQTFFKGIKTNKKGSSGDFCV